MTVTRLDASSSPSLTRIVASPRPRGLNAPRASMATIPAGSARQATLDVRSISPPRGPTPRAINWRFESPGERVIDAGLTRNPNGGATGRGGETTPVVATVRGRELGSLPV